MTMSKEFTYYGVCVIKNVIRRQLSHLIDRNWAEQCNELFPQGDTGWIKCLEIATKTKYDWLFCAFGPNRIDSRKQKKQSRLVLLLGDVSFIWSVFTASFVSSERNRYLIQL